MLFISLFYCYLVGIRILNIILKYEFYSVINYTDFFNVQMKIMGFIRGIKLQNLWDFSLNKCWLFICTNAIIKEKIGVQKFI